MMVDGFIGLTKAPINGVLALFEGMVNTAISYVNKLIDAANSLPGAKMLGLTRISPISLPRLARGGFAEGPTLGDHLANM